MTAALRTGLIGTLPEGTPNGADDIVHELAKTPLRKRVALVLFDAPKSAEDAEKGIKTWKLRILRIEPIRDEDDITQAHAMLVRLNESRFGAEGLPIDQENFFVEATDIAWEDGKYREVPAEQPRGVSLFEAYGTKPEEHPDYDGDPNSALDVAAFLEGKGLSRVDASKDTLFSDDEG